MYTTQWCPDCRRAKSLLNEHRVPFEEVNIEHVSGASEFVISVNQGKRRVPTFEIDGKTFHCSPYDPKKLLTELGLASIPDQEAKLVPQAPRFAGTSIGPELA